MTSEVPQKEDEEAFREARVGPVEDRVVAGVLLLDDPLEKSLAGLFIYNRELNYTYAIDPRDEVEHDHIPEAVLNALLNREALVVEPGADNLRGQERAEVADETNQGTGTDTEVHGLEVVGVLVEVCCPEDGKEQEDPSLPASLPESHHFGFEALLCAH